MPLFPFRGKKGILRIPVPFDPGTKGFDFGAEIRHCRESARTLKTAYCNQRVRHLRLRVETSAERKTKRHTLVSHPEESGDG